MKEKIIAIAIVALFFISSFIAVSANTRNDVEDNCNCNVAGNDASSIKNNLLEYHPTGLIIPEDWPNGAPLGKIEPKTWLPPSFDWRDEVGGLPPCKDQGNCGSCWAFATVGPLECNIKIKDGEIVDLSEQWLLSCNENDYGCDGGWFVHSMHYNLGAVMEDDLKYQANDGISCGTDGPYNHVYKLDDYYYISYNIASTEEMKQAIYDYGPIGTGIYCDSLGWQWHSLWNPNGIYESDSTNEANHAVTIVGWNDNEGSSDPGYWIVRNSWGTGFCNQGYIKIKYGICRIGTSANYVIYSGCDLDQVKKDGDEIAAQGGEVLIKNDYVILSEGGGAGWVSYEIPLNNPNNWDVDELWVGVEYRDEAIWGNGPDLFVENNGNWENLEEEMSGPDTYTWTWRRFTDTDSFIINNKVKIKMYADGNDDTWIRRAGIKYKLIPAYPDLNAYSDPSPIKWVDIDPGATKTATIYVENIGDPSSTLYYEVSEGYDWITCSKTSGTVPYGSTDSITVTVQASNIKQETRSGTITVKNRDDFSDYKSFNVDITTKKGKPRIFSFNKIIEVILSRFPFVNMLLHQIYVLNKF